MICYNIALNIHGMANHVFIDAFHEFTIMWPVAFLLEFFLVDKMAHHLAFKVVKPGDRPFVITLAISFYIICIMCPIMSFIATILFKTPGKEIISVWFMTILFNFPMAFFWQICYCGPFIRWIFKKCFHESNISKKIILLIYQQPLSFGFGLFFSYQIKKWLSQMTSPLIFLISKLLQQSL